jgi:pimeloyl-ACP methyl ester carboxylesterase
VLTGLLIVLSIAAAGALYQWIGTRRDVTRFPPRGRLIDVGGRRLHAVCDGGGGPGVVFESAIAASSLSWSRVLPATAAFARACAYDRAGLAWSDADAGPPALGRILDDLHAVMIAAAVPLPCVLVGHSFGCLLACAFAAKQPEQIAGLVLIDPPSTSQWRQPDRSHARMLWGGMQLSRIGGVLARFGVVRFCLALLTGGAPRAPRTFVKIFGPTAARTLERLVGEVRKLPPDVHPLVQAQWCQPKCFRAMGDYFRVLQEAAAFVAGLRALSDVPVVVISSGDQPDAQLEEHLALARLSAAGRHLRVPATGHWIQFDDPDLIVRVIREVVEQARRAPQRFTVPAPATPPASLASAPAVRRTPERRPDSGSPEDPS